jgi:hypothetical protein
MAAQINEQGEEMEAELVSLPPVTKTTMPWEGLSFLAIPFPPVAKDSSVALKMAVSLPTVPIGSDRASM